MVPMINIMPEIFRSSTLCKSSGAVDVPLIEITNFDINLRKYAIVI